MHGIAERLEAYAAAWRANDASLLETFWDVEDPQPLYKPEEIDGLLSGWQPLRDYWRHNQQFHERVDLSFSEIEEKPLGEDLRLAVFRMRWDILFAPEARLPDGTPFQWRGQAMGGDDHVVTLWRRRAGEWRLASWIECAMAPISYMAKLYLKDISPGFPARSESAGNTG